MELREQIALKFIESEFCVDNAKALSAWQKADDEHKRPFLTKADGILALLKPTEEVRPVFAMQNELEMLRANEAKVNARQKELDNMMALLRIKEIQESTDPVSRDVTIRIKRVDMMETPSIPNLLQSGKYSVSKSPSALLSEEEICRWTEDFPYAKTSCGHTWSLSSNLANHEKFKYCPYCGKLLISKLEGGGTGYLTEYLFGFALIGL
ncbi:MAG: hypothetical protein PHQ43_00025 [Dehalococcoidales bacterium]|nr:hypothetical protein [Dehalococcoidales bacterium]